MGFKRRIGFEKARVAEVYATGAAGGRVGSGYLLADGLVLTARHVVEPSNGVEVRPLEATEWTPASLAWSDEAADAAVLRTKDPLPAPGAPPGWGVVEGCEPVAVSAVCFPWAQARPSGVRDTEQLLGHVAPLSDAKEDRYAINVETSPPQRPDGSSGWAGMSGAALFAGPYLVGVVVVDPDRFGPERVKATPVAVLADDDDFARLVGFPSLTPVGSTDNRRRWSVLIMAAVVVGVALGLSWWVNRDSGRFDLAAVGDRLTVGDYNGDDKADVAMAYEVGDGTMEIYRWASTGSKFSDASRSKPFPLGTVAGRMASGDVDGECGDDIVMVSQDQTSFSFHVWLAGSTYDGRWYTSGSFTLGAVGDRFTVGDYTADGKADVAMAYDVGDGTMRMHVWASTGSEFTDLATTLSDSPLDRVGDRMASGDVDGDGKADVVMASQNPDGTASLQVWNAGNSAFRVWYTSGRFTLTHVDDRLTVGDYTGDGRKADVAMGNNFTGASQIQWWPSTGSSFEGSPTRLDSPELNLDNVAGRMASGDVNGDDKDDVVMAHQNPEGTFSFHLWSGASSSVARWYTSGRESPWTPGARCATRYHYPRREVELGGLGKADDGDQTSSAVPSFRR